MKGGFVNKNLKMFFTHNKKNHKSHTQQTTGLSIKFFFTQNKKKTTQNQKERNSQNRRILANCANRKIKTTQRVLFF